MICIFKKGYADACLSLYQIVVYLYYDIGTMNLGDFQILSVWKISEGERVEVDKKISGINGLSQAIVLTLTIPMSF